MESLVLSTVRFIADETPDDDRPETCVPIEDVAPSKEELLLVSLAIVIEEPKLLNILLEVVAEELTDFGVELFSLVEDSKDFCSCLMLTSVLVAVVLLDME